MQQVGLNCRKMSGGKMSRKRNIIIYVIVVSVFCLFGCSFTKDKNVKDKVVSEKDEVDEDVEDKQFMDSDASPDVDDNLTEGSGQKEVSDIPEEKNNTEANEKDSLSEVVDDTSKEEPNINQDISDGIVLPEDEW